MPRVTVLPHPEWAPNGATFETGERTSICDALLSNNVDIEHACGQVGACTTCHVVVTRGFDTLSPMDEDEEDMLDQAWGLQPYSRLSCQAVLDKQDIVVEIPRYSINHAKEAV
jgi:2Fe-2S ferredoxin